MCLGESSCLTYLFVHFDCGKPLISFLELLSVPGICECGSFGLFFNEAKVEKERERGGRGTEASC